MTRTALRLFALLAAAFALHAQADATVATKHFLWEVASMTNHIYLYGTVHAGRKDWVPLPAEIEEAFNQSDVLVVEADITDDAAMARSAPAMLLKPPDTLKSHVDAADYARFLKLLPRYGLSEAQLSSMKPFMAVSILVFGEWARSGYVPQFGVDAYLIRKAKAELKPVVELEGVAAQMQLVESMDDAESRKLFGGTVLALQDGLTGDQIDGMVAAWRTGDAAALLEIARKYNDVVPGAREFEEKFIWSRHPAMLKKLEGFLDDSRQPHFVAVGALHLAGDRGLVALLAKHGYRVTQR